ncbi:hypothetical protein ACHAXT_002836 [Thalassiosira profunda]
MDVIIHRPREWRGEEGEEEGEAAAERDHSSWEGFLDEAVATYPGYDFVLVDGKHNPPDGDWETFGRVVGSNARIGEITFGRDDGLPTRDISAIDFEAFSRGISRSQSIFVLRFSELGLGGRHFDTTSGTFAPIFRGSLPLLHLNFEHCELSPECVRSLCSTLQEIGSLKSFTYKDIIEPDSEDCRDIIQALSRHHRLEELDLSENPGLEEDAYAALASLLARPNGRLLEINLADNDIDDKCAVVFAKGLLAGNGSLRQLGLERSLLRFASEYERRVEERDPDGWQAIFSSLQQSACTLDWLALALNYIDDAAAVSLGNALAAGKVKTLDLSRTRGITHEGYRALFEPLSAPTCIVEKLFLSENSDLDDEGISCLASALIGNESIRELNLDRCTLVTAAGWEPLMAVIQNSNMERLHLGGNAINTAAVLANSLIGNVTLKELILWDCGLDDGAARLLANALADNSTLLEMRLGGSDLITDIGWSAFSHVLCNAASIDATFDSNHTVRALGGYNSPEDLKTLVEMNRENSESEAARLKIIKTHFEHPPFVEMELALLPHALAWMGRGGGSGEVDGRFWGYLRSMPSLFDAKNKGSMAHNIAN